MLYALCLGQSNGDGRDNRGHMNISSLVTVRNNPANTFTETDTTSGMGTAWIAPAKNAAPFFINNSNGGLRSYGNNHAGVHACDYLARMTGQSIRLINACRGSTPLSYWMDENGNAGPQYTRLCNLLSAASVTAIDVLFLQWGEGDNGEASLFDDRLGHLLDRMQSDGFITASTPVVLGQPRPQYSNSIAAFASIEGGSGRIRVAATQNYPADDDTHFNGDALGYIGYEYVKALQRMTTPPFSLPADAGIAERVYARGFLTKTVPPATLTDVPLIGDHGRLLAMHSDGYMTTWAAGRWRFAVSGYVNRAKPRWYLLNASNSVIAYLSMSLVDDANQNASVISSRAELILPQGSVVKLGVYHGGTSDATIDAGSAWNYISLSAEYLGPL